MKQFNKDKCLPIMLKSIEDFAHIDYNHEICEVMHENITRGHWQEMLRLSQDCPKPCSTLEFRGEAKMYHGWSDPGIIQLGMYFSSNEIKVQEEYLVYGDVDLVGIVGGNLGLFVGFSFYDKIEFLIDLFADRFLS